MTTFNPGDEVYSIDGQVGNYLAQTHNGHLVEPIFEYDDREPAYGKPTLWNQVFATPPVEKLHEEIAKLEQLRQAEYAKLASLQRQVMDEKKEFDSRAAIRKQFSQLKKLDDFIAGKITHLVILADYGDDIAIEEFSAAIIAQDNDRYDKKQRLLSLYGDSNGDLSWNLDRYSNGSGSYGRSGFCWPATSLEEAKQIATAWLSNKFAICTSNNKWEKVLSYIACAKKLDMEIPTDILNKGIEIKKASSLVSISQAQAEISRATEKLNKFLEDHKGLQSSESKV